MVGCIVVEDAWFGVWRFAMAGFVGGIDDIGISVIGGDWFCGGWSWFGVGLLKIVIF